MSQILGLLETGYNCSAGMRHSVLLFAGRHRLGPAVQPPPSVPLDRDRMMLHRLKYLPATRLTAHLHSSSMQHLHKTREQDDKRKSSLSFCACRSSRADAEVKERGWVLGRRRGRLLWRGHVQRAVVASSQVTEQAARKRASRRRLPKIEDSPEGNELKI
eukprot:1493001-Pleurochrysis_carterae.AAC.3